MRRLGIAFFVLGFLPLAVPADGPPIPPLIDTLKTPGESARARAAADLAKLGRPAVAALVPLLRHEEEAVRYCALAALRQMGDGAKEARVGIVRALQDADPEVRHLAVSTLPQLSLEEAELVPLLLRAAADDDCDVEHEAKEQLYRLRAGAVPALCRAMRDPRARWNAGPTLRFIGVPPSASQFEAMLDLLSKTSTPRTVSEQDCWDFWDSWMRARKDSLFLVNRLLFHGDRAKRLRLASLIAGLHDDQTPVDPEIIEAILKTFDAKNSVDRKLRAAATRITPRRNQVSALVLARLLRDEDEEIRAKVCFDLGYPGRFGRGAGNVVSGVLRQALVDRDFWVRLAAARALVDLQDDPTTFLQGILKRGDRREKLRAATVLLSSDPESREARAVLVSELEGTDRELRPQAAAALLLYPRKRETRGAASSRPRPPSGKQAERCFAVLTEGLKGGKDTDRHYAVRVFSEMKGAAAPAVPALLDALTATDVRLRAEVVRALGTAVESELQYEGPLLDGRAINPGWSLRPDAKTTVPRVARLLDDPDRDVRLAAVQTLATFGAAAARDLGRAMKDSHCRPQTCDILYHMGAEARNAIPALVELLKDAEQGEDAAWLLMSIDTSRRVAVRENLSLLVGEDAARLLMSIDPSVNLRHVIDMLKRKDAQVRHALADAGAGRIGWVTVQRLAALLANSNGEVRTRAVHSLHAIGQFLGDDDRIDLRALVKPSVTTLIPGAIGRLKSSKGEVRRQAVAELLALRGLYRLYPARFGLSDDALARAKLDDAMDSALKAARDDSDLEVRRKARKATREPLHPRPGA